MDVNNLQEDGQHRPYVVRFDDWSDVLKIIEFEKSADTSQPAHQDGGSGGSGGSGGCLFIVFKIIVAMLFRCIQGF